MRIELCYDVNKIEKCEVVKKIWFVIKKFGLKGGYVFYLRLFNG